MAGFNQEAFPRLKDVIVVTEPEAAAAYTARQLREEEGRDFLKVNSPTHKTNCNTYPLQVGECFVLCDAGGGTVVSQNVQSSAYNAY